MTILKIIGVFSGLSWKLGLYILGTVALEWESLLQMSAKTLLLALIGLISLVSSLTIPADSDACETPTVEK